MAPRITRVQKVCQWCHMQFTVRASRAAKGEGQFCSLVCVGESRRGAKRNLPIQRPIEDRFWEKVEKTDTCWNWIGARNHSEGYGVIGERRRIMYVHRLSWKMHRGLIPDGMEIDHLCRNRVCVNPDHLEPVTHEENMRRAREARAA